jgi:hypothetical protein
MAPNPSPSAEHVLLARVVKELQGAGVSGVGDAILLESLRRVLEDPNLAPEEASALLPDAGPTDPPTDPVDRFIACRVERALAVALEAGVARRGLRGDDRLPARPRRARAIGERDPGPPAEPRHAADRGVRRRSSRGPRARRRARARPLPRAPRQPPDRREGPRPPLPGGGRRADADGRRFGPRRGPRARVRSRLRAARAHARGRGARVHRPAALASAAPPPDAASGARPGADRLDRRPRRLRLSTASTSSPAGSARAGSASSTKPATCASTTGSPSS